jgi:demethylmenaquinone methyltransferase/2-methoxy-6-polyprenyl-1,4-benzoquinol methylase
MMVYFWETMDTCVRPEAVVSALKAAGFQDARRIACMNVFSEYAAVKAG